MGRDKAAKQAVYRWVGRQVSKLVGKDVSRSARAFQDLL